MAELTCKLDPPGQTAQRARYRALGAHVEATERRGDALVIGFDPTVDRALLAETVAVERECCPFFAITVDGRRLTLRVADPAHAPAFDAIADALDSHTAGRLHHG
jgi:hypothetical protein